jgi:putative hydrolase of the HAD superfamily
MIKAVLWDFGGVITSSPFEAFNRFEQSNNLPKDFIRRINSTNPDTNAWAQFESSQISLDEFDSVFASEAISQGHEVRGRQVIELLSGEIRPAMVNALNIIAKNYKVACLTNNVKGAGEGPGMQRSSDKAEEVAKIMSIFDVIIESSVVGYRKPDPKFYVTACDALDIKPEEAVFLDDLGINLKPAKALGMETIKVLGVDQTLEELEILLDLHLR